MFRESKKDERVLEKILNELCTKMPRTMLRYSIEKFECDRRKYYLNKKG